ncbi:unnamed protein product [Didymodactylos carnosus]|uniref:Uncharacterized protein n=1 Tax=Didymodactylos carnosus TaxID=1234261 RepID=A0A813YU94_9BILA|nr:unnamed protein product [Didymodactylos carnosus]CAF0971328.1 unnamed protein product [Didymodactylos carnosus]CAF3673556.1 unnamed protein product [Didymodactylos carnosus]CAF3742660.1 unnamed protein product [Didymodactylos carnosus]
MKNNPLRTKPSSICGNGIVEVGEDCDCGVQVRNNSCITVEACCNPKTCLFYDGAECLGGECCDACKFIKAEVVCRSSKNDCDLPEHCTGTSSQCPEDITVLDGSSCNEGIGTCHNGRCVGNQCREIWGSGAKQAHESCYSYFNPSGTISGHCGHDSRLDKYIPCFESDVHCGLLHCEGGRKIPQISTNNFITFLVNTKDLSYECKSISGSTNSILVNDGSVCGLSSFCLNNKCVQQDLKQCPMGENHRMCSGNGICSSLGTCYCLFPWSGTVCSIQSRNETRFIRNEKSSLPSYHLAHSPVTTVMLTSLGSITFGLLIFCFIMSFLYRKKTPNKKTKTTISLPNKQQTYQRNDYFNNHALISHPMNVVTGKSPTTISKEENRLYSKIGVHYSNPHEQKVLSSQTINPSKKAADHPLNYTSTKSISCSLTSTPILSRPTVISTTSPSCSLQRSSIMNSSRSIYSATTGLSYVDTPRSIRCSGRKLSTSHISDSEASPHFRSNRRPRNKTIGDNSSLVSGQYASLSLKRSTARYEPVKYHQSPMRATGVQRTIKSKYNTKQDLKSEEQENDREECANLKDFIEVLDTLARQKFGTTDSSCSPKDEFNDSFDNNPDNSSDKWVKKESTFLSSSPTETQSSLMTPADSGYTTKFESRESLSIRGKSETSVVIALSPKHTRHLQNKCETDKML